MTFSQLRMARNVLWLVQLLQILLFLLCQSLPLGLNGLLQALDAAETNNGAANSLIDPGQGHVTHLPASLLSNLLHSPDDLEVSLG